jgi:hypothetical protein
MTYRREIDKADVGIPIVGNDTRSSPDDLQALRAFIDELSPGEGACLAIVARRVLADGYCNMSIDEIAAEAHVSRATCQNAMREAERVGLITDHRGRCN